MFHNLILVHLLDCYNLMLNNTVFEDEEDDVQDLYHDLVIEYDYADRHNYTYDMNDLDMDFLRAVCIWAKWRPDF